MPSQVMTNRYFAKLYNWTPQQVAELSIDDLVWLPIIETAEAKVVERMNREASRSSSGPARRMGR